MEKVFGLVLNMSMTASVVIVPVLMLRLLFGKVSRNFSYLLWLPVLFRLLCPVAWETDLGLLPQMNLFQINRETEQMAVTEDSKMLPSQNAAENITSVIEGQDEAPRVEGAKPSSPETAADRVGKYVLSGQIGISEKTAEILGIVWIFGVCGLLFYEVVCYTGFIRRLQKDGQIKSCDGQIKNARIFIGKQVKEPFVAGVIKPVIYLPEDMETEKRELVILHEHMHIRRLDYLVKPLYLLGCCVHWFNPLVWLSFYLMVRDMESSCDELVLRQIGYERRKEYAYTLLALSSKEGWRAGYPLAFGENNVKDRVKNMMKSKKVATWLIVLTAFAAGMATLLLLGSRPAEEELSMEAQAQQKIEIHEQQDVKAQEQQSSMEKEVQYLPAEEMFATDVPGTDTNEDTTFLPDHEYYGDAQGDGTATGTSQYTDYIDTNGTQNQLSEELERGNMNGDTTASYEPGEDKFAVLLLDTSDANHDIGIAYRYPVEGAEVSNTYGTRIHPITGEERVHSGVDFAAEEGTPVVAAADGLVAETGFQSYCGNYVIIRHENGEVTYYTSCKEILTSEGTEVKAGQQIATVGKTGASTGAHLHFAISKDGVYKEPVFAVITPVEESKIKENEMKEQLQAKVEAQLQAAEEAQKEVIAQMQAQLEMLTQ